MNQVIGLALLSILMIGCNIEPEANDYLESEVESKPEFDQRLIGVWIDKEDAMSGQEFTTDGEINYVQFNGYESDNSLRTTFTTEENEGKSYIVWEMYKEGYEIADGKEEYWFEGDTMCKPLGKEGTTLYTVNKYWKKEN